MSRSTATVLAIAAVAATFVLGCQGPPGPPGPPGPAGPPGGSAFQVVDSTAPTPQVLGTFLYPADVLIQSGSHTFSLGAQRGKLFGRVELYYTGAGCTGTPFIWAPASFENLIPLAAIGQSSLVFIPDVTAASASFNQVSKVDRDTGTCVADSGASIQGKPAFQVFDLTPFTAPYSLQ